MLENSSAIQLCKQYSQGKRQFPNLRLEDANLAELSLSQIDLSSSQLARANLGQANLTQASFRESSLVEANFSRANLTQANFTGADLSKTNFTGANIAGASFARANLSRANFSLVRLSASKGLSLEQNIEPAKIVRAERVSFSGANLKGAFFLGVDLISADLEGAIYSKNTNFSANFDPIKAGMIQAEDIQELDLKKLLAYFNQLFGQSSRYLGFTISSKYFNASRPDYNWLNLFQIDENQKIYFVQNTLSFANPEQAQYFQQWIDNFIASCSRVIKNFPELENEDEDNDEELFSGFS